MPRKSIRLAIHLNICISALTSVAGCSVIGPESIIAARTSYNDAIQTTSKEQTLLNLVRVRDSEAPAIVDVTGVDAGYNLTQGTTGIASGLGGLVTGESSSMINYSDTPNVHYQTLSGAPLIAQLSTPITAEAISNLIDSGWPVEAVFMLGVSNLTSNSLDYDIALNAILALTKYRSIRIAAIQSVQKVSSAQTDLSSAKDALAIFYSSGNIAGAGLMCDDPRALNGTMARDRAREIAGTLWQRLQRIYNQKGDVIILRSSSSPYISGKNVKSDPPLLRTRSAFGVMKDAVEDDRQPTVSFVTPERAAIIRQTKNIDCSGSFYLDLLPETELPESERNIQNNRPITSVNQWLSYGRSPFTMHPFEANLSREQQRDEINLGNPRRFIIVETTSYKPEGASTSVFRNGIWYSVRNDDYISKRNLSLVNLFNTIQAVAPVEAGPVRTINVGAR